MPHGDMELPTDVPPDTIGEILFGARHPVNLNCAYLNNSAPPNLVIDGEYRCYTTVPPEPPPVRLFAQGTLNLVPSRISPPK